MVLLGDAQPCVPDHVSHLIMGGSEKELEKDKVSTHSRVSRSRDDENQEGERGTDKEGKVLEVKTIFTPDTTLIFPIFTPDTNQVFPSLTFSRPDKCSVGVSRHLRM